jgi:alpha-galactosidase
MLPLGRLRITDKNGARQQTRFTVDEQQTLMTLWSIFRLPLIFGGDLPSADAATVALLTNRELLDINQNSSGNRRVLERGNVRGWLADASGGKDKYAAVFNLGDAAEKILLDWTKLGIQITNPALRDLWQHKSMGRQKNLEITLRPHALVLYRVSPYGRTLLRRCSQSAVTADQTVRGTVVRELRLGGAFDFRNDALRQNFSKFHAPLVE